RPREGRPSLGGRDNTIDLVKRRYSTRFAGGVPYPDGSPVPAVPGLPAQYARGDSRSPARDGRSPERGAGRLRVDPRALKDPQLQADKYVESVLSDATEDDIHAFQNELQNVKAHTSTDLQHNVYQNRTQFVKISKEADRLKSEMRMLRSLMSELTSALGHATSAGGTDDFGSAGSRLSVIADRKRANRSSVANLEAMWTSHLQVLWKRVEGSQKYLPAIPGRHIIMESQRWVELNAATWKPRRRVALVLLNDHLLISSEKKRADAASSNQNAATQPGNRTSIYQQNQPSTDPQRQNQPASSTSTLVAERCWPLQDISLADISSHHSKSITHSHTREHAAIANAINIRAGNESFTYATTDSAEKAGLLVAFRKAQEDLRKLVASTQQQGERGRFGVGDELGLAMRAGRDPRQAELGGLGGLSRSNSILIDVDGRQQSIRWVEGQIDTLDIDIALQRFEQAVSRVESLRKLARGIKGNATAQEIITTKIDSRATKLAHNIARQLINTSSGLERTKTNASWLARLGHEDMARSRYLTSRTETLRIRTRQIPFTGSLPPYLHALAYTTFTLLLHTLRCWNAAFPAPSAGSAVVAWARERVEEFNEVLVRRMEGVERGGEVWGECVRVVGEQVGLLKEVGVDFGGVVGR
ncbi:hypothetical protein BAUCODRAFT_47995, partial [Baudoinia panamericana UAMH 10762]